MKDGSYKANKIAKLHQARAYEFLSNIKSELTRSNFNWRDVSVKGEKKFHPSESNGYLAVIVRIGTVDFNIPFTASKIVSIQLIHTNSTKQEISKSQIAKIESKFSVKVGEPKADNKYSWIEPREYYKDIKSLIERLEDFRSVIESR